MVRGTPVGNHGGAGLLVDRHREANLHEFTSGCLLGRRCIQIRHRIAGGRIETVQAEARGLVDALAAPERLHQAFALFRAVELPGQPHIVFQTVSRERIVVAQIVLAEPAPLIQRAANHLVIQIRAAYVETGGEVGAQDAAQQIRTDLTRSAAGAVVGIPERDAIRVALVADRLHDVVAPQQRHRTAQCLQVVAATTGGTGVD